MNRAQIESIVRSLIQLGLGALAARGYALDADIVAALPAVVASIVVAGWGVSSHEPQLQKPSSSLFLPRELNALHGVNPRLVSVLKRAKLKTSTPWVIYSGVRTAAEQRKLVAAGKSRTLDSRHLTGDAIDFFVGTPRNPDWNDKTRYREVADAIIQAGRELGVEIVSGCDWGWDCGHIEIPRK